MSRATATGIRCIAAKKKIWQPGHRVSPKPTMRRQCRRRKPGSRRIARNSAGDRMSPATPIRTSSAAPSDQPASSSGLMNGPLDEKASADATAMSSPVVLHARAATRRSREAMRSRRSCGSACHE